MHRATALELALSGALTLVAGAALLAAFGLEGASAEAAPNLTHHLLLAELAADSGSAKPPLPAPTPAIATPTLPPVVVPAPVSTPAPTYVPVPPYSY